MSIQDLPGGLRTAALDLWDQGYRFEGLVRRALQGAEISTRQYDEALLWKDWPGRDNRPNTGNALVARPRDGGQLTAIQRRFDGPGHLFSKADIDSLLSLLPLLSSSGEEGFTERAIVSTTEWGKSAEETTRCLQLRGAEPGKTFTSLKIGEQHVDVGGGVLSSVQSISLITRKMAEWMARPTSQSRPRRAGQSSRSGWHAVRTGRLSQ